MTKSELEKLDKVALRFTASWCGPCKQYAPKFDAASKSFPNIQTVVVDMTNTTENSDERILATDYNIRSIPCTLFLKNGVVVSRIDGDKQEDVITKAFEELNV